MKKSSKEASVLTASSLRANLYSVLDDVAERGETVDLIRKGKRIQIRLVSDVSQSRLEKLKKAAPKRSILRGDVDDFVSLKWEWDEGDLS